VFTGADSLPLIIKGLSSPNEEVVLNTIATLYFLVTPQTYSRTNRLVLNSCFQTECNQRVKDRSWPARLARGVASRIVATRDVAELSY